MLNLSKKMNIITLKLPIRHEHSDPVKSRVVQVAQSKWQTNTSRASELIDFSALDKNMYIRTTIFGSNRVPFYNMILIQIKSKNVQMTNLSNAISEAFPACEKIENILKKSLSMRSVRKWGYPEKISIFECGAKVPRA